MQVYLNFIETNWNVFATFSSYMKQYEDLITFTKKTEQSALLFNSMLYLFWIFWFLFFKAPIHAVFANSL